MSTCDTSELAKRALSVFTTPTKEAVHKIANCYAIDAKTCQRDEFYYFIKKH